MSALYGLVATPNPLIRQVRVPVPYPLQYVNAYLIAGDNGWTVVDPGIHTDEAVALWERVWLETGSRYRDVERIVLTHHHPDHYGLAGYFQEKSGAPVFLSERGKRQADEMWGGDDALTQELWRLFLDHGMDRETAAAMIPHMAGFVSLVSPRPEVALIRNGDVLRLGDSHYEAVETGGHAAGHMSFYGKDSQEMFCGDAVLPRISPNISYMPRMEEDPLAEFTAGLGVLGSYEVKLAYPGHRDSFGHFAGRCGELVVHHEKRLAIMRAHVAEAPCTAFDCCTRLFGTRLTIHQQRFAMSETIAHLVHLEKKGQLRRSAPNGVHVFSAVVE
ncbi:MAG: beta-lactamase [Paenibacillaceae bacterium]|jgi:glyoxylase-like metal-dependent hydrolase (beta-lactamase superfamily II)|nr:beta-lactamase [Paenibacillaceae bacterium]